MTRILRFAVAALALAPALAQAAPAPKVDQAPAVQAVIQCRTMTDTAQRLACFDAAAARLDDAQAKGDLVTIDRAQRRTLRRESFGFALPSLSIFDKGEPAEEVATLALKVTHASQDPQGRWQIELEGGQYWHQTSSDVLARDPRPGSQAVIKKGALGSFDMKIDGQPSIRVRRER
jgi:hypothetical protein